MEGFPLYKLILHDEPCYFVQKIGVEKGGNLFLILNILCFMTSEKHHHTCVRPPSVSMYNRYESTTVCVVYHHLPSLFMQCNISDPDAALHYQTQCLVNHLAADMT